MTTVELGVFFAIVGAILKYAVGGVVAGVSLPVAGVILMVAGGFLVLYGMIVQRRIW